MMVGALPPAAPAASLASAPFLLGHFTEEKKKGLGGREIQGEGDDLDEVLSI